MMGAEPIVLWIVLVATLLPVGSVLLLLTHVVEFLVERDVIVVAGVIRRRLPALSGSLFVRSSAIRIGIGLESYRPNRTYYRLAIAWGG
jgi:hypothetical protein